MWPFSRKVRRQLGIDIGTSSIKVVELERDNGSLSLANYGFIDGLDFFGDVPTSPNSPSSFKVSENDVAMVLKQLFSSAKIKTKNAVISIPIFSSFLTVMELPALSQKELESAVPFEARSYIPVPLAEVVLDWMIIPAASPQLPSTKLPRQSSGQVGTGGSGQANLTVPSSPIGPATPTVSGSTSVLGQPTGKVHILLIAVPKEVVSKYQRIAAAAELIMTGLEAESFSLARSLAGNDLGTIMLIDLGARSTNLTIVDRGYIYMSHSADLSGREITKVISHGLGVAVARAEELKKTSGVAAAGAEKGLAQVISPIIDKLVVEVERMNSAFFKKENRRVEKMILSGGSANLPGVNEYLSRHIGLETITGNPFRQIKFEPILEPVLRRDLSPNLAVAAGLAMREL